MPKIISAFNGESPIGDTIAKLGASMFGGPSTDNALKNEQLYALQRKNVELDNYAKLVAKDGIMPTANNPIAQAMILAAEMDPRNSAYLGRMDAATRYGADDPHTANWQIASGDPYSSTATAFNKNLAETVRSNDITNDTANRKIDVEDGTNRWKHTTLSAEDEAVNNWRKYNTDQTQLTARTKMEPAFDPVTQQPVFRPANELQTVQPIVSEADRKGILLGQNFNDLGALDVNQRQVLGANPTADRLGTPRNYIIPGAQPIITYDGVTSARDGTQLPQGGYLGTVEGSADATGVTTKTLTGDLQGNTISNKKYKFLSDKLMALTNDPTLFGPAGFMRSTLQEVNEGMRGISSIIDPDPVKAAAEVEAARTEARRLGLPIPNLYDPRLPEVQTLSGLLVFQGAKALADQEGREIGAADVVRMEKIFGNPQSLFSSAESVRAKLKQADDLVSGFDTISREALDGNAPVTSPFGEQPAVVDPNAQPTQIKGVDDYNALPPGTKYIDPNGVPRVKGSR